MSSFIGLLLYLKNLNNSKKSVLFKLLSNHFLVINSTFWFYNLRLYIKTWQIATTKPIQIEIDMIFSVNDSTAQQFSSLFWKNSITDNQGKNNKTNHSVFANHLIQVSFPAFIWSCGSSKVPVPCECVVNSVKLFYIMQKE